MGPAALAITTAAIVSALDDERLAVGSQLYAPSSRGLRSYLDRMNFFQVALHARGMNQIEHHDAPGTLECQQFICDQDLRPITLGILDVLASQANLSVEARAGLDVALSEILENVLFHADAKHGGVVAVQTFKNGEIELAIVDLGVGIATSLGKNTEYAERANEGDLEAIRTAMEPRVTSTPWRNAGLGLAYTTELLRINGGQLWVRSGEGVVGRGEKTVDRTTTDGLPGTLVAMRVKADGPIDHVGAWAPLEEAGGTVV